MWIRRSMWPSKTENLRKCSNSVHTCIVASYVQIDALWPRHVIFVGEDCMMSPAKEHLHYIHVYSKTLLFWILEGNKKILWDSAGVPNACKYMTENYIQQWKNWLEIWIHVARSHPTKLSIFSLMDNLFQPENVSKDYFYGHVSLWL